MRNKIQAAAELQEVIHTIGDTEATRVFPNIVAVILEILRTTEGSVHEDSPEYQCRRTLVDILHRITSSESVRQQVLALMQDALHILRHDNEENGVTACKIIADIVRIYRILNQEIVNQFMAILTELLRNMRNAVEELLSEDSAPVDPNVVQYSNRSFKVLVEMGMIIVTFCQIQRNVIAPLVQANLALNLEVLQLEAPAQKKARENYEAMGGFWAGMAPTIRNGQAYTDFIIAQIKVSCSSCAQPQTTYIVAQSWCPIWRTFLGGCQTCTMLMETLCYWSLCAYSKTFQLRQCQLARFVVRASFPNQSVLSSTHRVGLYDCL